MARHKVGVGDIVRRRHEPVNVHPGIVGEHDAIWIDQEDGAVGRERAGDGRRIAADHAIERDGCAGWLLEFGTFTRSDAEALPIDDRFITLLSDHHLVRRRLRDRGITADYDAALGIGQSRDRRQGRRCQ